MPCAPSSSARLRRAAPRFTTPRSRSCVGLFRSIGSKDQRSRAGLQAAKPVRAARLPRRTAPGPSGSDDVLSRRLVSLLQRSASCLPAGAGRDHEARRQARRDFPATPQRHSRFVAVSAGRLENQLEGSPVSSRNSATLAGFGPLTERTDNDPPLLPPDDTWDAR